MSENQMNQMLILFGMFGLALCLHIDLLVIYHWKKEGHTLFTLISVIPSLKSYFGACLRCVVRALWIRMLTNLDICLPSPLFALGCHLTLKMLNFRRFTS